MRSAGFSFFMEKGTFDLLSGLLNFLCPALA